MNRKLEIFESVLTSPFNNDSFVGFVREFLNNVELIAPTKYNKEYSNFSFYVDGYYHIGNYNSDDNNLHINKIEINVYNTEIFTKFVRKDLSTINT